MNGWMDQGRQRHVRSSGTRDDGERVRLRVADKGGTDGGVMELGAPKINREDGGRE